MRTGWLAFYLIAFVASIYLSIISNEHWWALGWWFLSWSNAKGFFEELNRNA